MGDYVRGKLNKQLPHISMKTHQTGDTRRAGSQASLQIGEIFQKYLLITRNLDTVQEKLVYFPWNFVRFSELFKYQEWDGDKQIVMRLSAVSTPVCSVCSLMNKWKTILVHDIWIPPIRAPPPYKYVEHSSLYTNLRMYLCQINHMKLIRFFCKTTLVTILVILLLSF